MADKEYLKVIMSPYVRIKKDQFKIKTRYSKLGKTTHSVREKPQEISLFSLVPAKVLSGNQSSLLTISVQLKCVMSFDAKKKPSLLRKHLVIKKKNPSTNITAQKILQIRPYE